MFLSARYRPNVWPFWVLTVLEFCLTVALLAFVGIAAPNLYRTKLWGDGAENGFNSSPLAGLYAAANYRPYTTPKVWSQFITNYNLIIVVFSMFLMLVKSIMYMLHVFPPIVNCAVHLMEIAIYTVSIYYQASPDLSDPTRPQHGPPWYITKSCNVAKYRSNVGYCQQAKATFFCMVGMLIVFLTYFGFALFSCFPSKQQQAEYAEKQKLKKEKYAAYSPEEQQEQELPKTARSMAYTIPETPGIENLNPMTPRTFTFNKLSGAKQMPLRIQVAKKNTEAPEPASIPLRSPKFPRFAKKATPAPEAEIQPESSEAEIGNGKAPMYFPPPPKSSK